MNNVKVNKENRFIIWNFQFEFIRVNYIMTIDSKHSVQNPFPLRKY